MAEPLLHPKTKAQVAAFLTKPSQAVLVTGPAGSGKGALSRLIAAKLVGTTAEELDNYPYLLALSKPDDKQEISIDSVRQVLSELKLKPVLRSHGAAHKIVLIDGAHQLSEEAQNALLKIIEEPPAGTVFILTAPTEADVLPTIASRVQTISISPVALRSALSYFKATAPEQKIESAWSLSQGSAGLLSAIIADDQQHPVKQAVESVKSFLKMTRYERIIYLDGLSADKAELGIFLDALNRVLAALQHSAVDHDKKSQIKQLTRSRKLANRAVEELAKNASVRLICLNLAVNLPV